LIHYRNDILAAAADNQYVVIVHIHRFKVLGSGFSPAADRRIG
jgi:hypothetical protein